MQLNNDACLVVCIWKYVDDLPEGSPVRNNPVGNVCPDLAPLDHTTQPKLSTYFTHHLHFHSPMIADLAQLLAPTGALIVIECH